MCKKSVCLILASFFTLNGYAEKVFKVTEQRELTTLEKRPVKLDVTSRERFEPPNSSSEETIQAPKAQFTYETPAGWTEVKTTQFRLVNMAIEGGGEAYVSISRGDVLQNINRWMKQFQAPNLTEADLASLETIEILGQEGFIVTAEGEFKGMAGKGGSGQKLVGAITKIGRQIITVKFTAPKLLAEQELENFKVFTSSLARKDS